MTHISGEKIVFNPSYLWLSSIKQQLTQNLQRLTIM